MNESPAPDSPLEVNASLPDREEAVPHGQEPVSSNDSGLAPDQGADGASNEHLGADASLDLSAAEGLPPAEPPRPQRPLDPPKLVRLANLAREVLEEVRQMTPQESTVQDLAALYRRVEDQLKDALPEPLAEELEAMNLDMPFRDEASQDEVRIALSGLIGWLGGLFQGLHASLLAAAPVLELPPEAGPPGMMPGHPPNPRPGLQHGRPMSPEERKGEGYL